MLKIPRKGQKIMSEAGKILDAQKIYLSNRKAALLDNEAVVFYLFAFGK